MGDNWINTNFLGVAIWVVFQKYAKALTVFVTAEALSLLCLIVATDSIPKDLAKKPTSLVDGGCSVGGSSKFLAKIYGVTAKGVTLSLVQARRAQDLATTQGLSKKWRDRGYLHCQSCCGFVNGTDQDWSSLQVRVSYQVQPGVENKGKKKAVKTLLIKKIFEKSSPNIHFVIGHFDTYQEIM